MKWLQEVKLYQKTHNCCVYFTQSSWKAPCVCHFPGNVTFIEVFLMRFWEDGQKYNRNTFFQQTKKSFCTLIKLIIFVPQLNFDIYYKIAWNKMTLEIVERLLNWVCKMLVKDQELLSVLFVLFFVTF